MPDASSTNARLPILVTFSGIDGAGKSTQIDKLCKRLAEAGLSVRQFTFWDNVVPFSRLRAAFSHKFLDSEGGIGAAGKPVNRNDKNVRTWYLSAARSALYLMDALSLRRSVTAARKCGSDVVIFDRYLYDQLAVLPLEHTMGRQYARFLLSLVPTPNVAYLLDADPEAARARKPEYPIDFLRQYRSNYLRLQTLAGLALIPPLTVEGAHDAIMQRFIARRPADSLKPSSGEFCTSGDTLVAHSSKQ